MAEVAAAPSRAASAEWRRCPSCEAFVYHKRLRRNLRVCPECNHHFRLRIRDRVDMLLDEGSFEELSGDLEPRRRALVRRLEALPGADRRGAEARPARSRARSTAPARSTASRSSSPASTSASSAAAWAARSARRSRGRRELALERADSAARDLRLRRRADAGGLRLADADGQDEPGDRAAERGGRPLHLAAHRPDLRRRERVVRDARRRADRRAGRPHRVRRPVGDRADDPPDSCPTASRRPAS